MEEKRKRETEKRSRKEKQKRKAEKRNRKEKQRRETEKRNREEKQKRKTEDIMNRFEYIVESIDGDYAHLRRIDGDAPVTEELKLVARALLPPEIMEGTKLLYEWMQYTIME